MKIYIVNQNHYDFYSGSFIEEKTIGYFVSEEKAKEFAENHKQDQYHTVGDAEVIEVETLD